MGRGDGVPRPVLCALPPAATPAQGTSLEKHGQPEAIGPCPACGGCVSHMSDAILMPASGPFPLRGLCRPPRDLFPPTLRAPSSGPRASLQVFTSLSRSAVFVF